MTVPFPTAHIVTEPIFAECKARGGSEACLLVTDE